MSNSIVSKALAQALVFHKKRDEMNAALHGEEVRYSNLTILLMKATENTPPDTVICPECRHPAYRDEDGTLSCEMTAYNPECLCYCWDFVK